MNCPICQSKNLQFVPAYRGCFDEPGYPAFFECLDCGAACDDEADDGSLADYQMELMEGKAA